MKNLVIASVIAIMNLTCVPSVIASDARFSKVHISVLGLSFGDSPRRVTEKLTPRFVPEFPTQPERGKYVGQIQGSNVIIWPWYTPKSKQLASVHIQIHRYYKSFDGVVLEMESWSQRLSRKYGAPTQKIRTAKSADDFKPIRGQYEDRWRLADGNISCSIFSTVLPFDPDYFWVNISYYHDAMSDLSKVEQQSMYEDDL